MKEGNLTPRDPLEERKCRTMGPLKGKSPETSSSDSVYTKQQRIAELARRNPDMVLTTLAHHMDMNWFREAYRRTRKSGASGVDEQTAADYERDLERNLCSLMDRAKAGTYYAPPVRRAYIPKAGKEGDLRPIGIPTFEDKVLQRAVVMLLEPVFEQDFIEKSYGFRPGRSQHQALKALRERMMSMGGGWIVELDIRKFFDSMDRRHLRDIVRQRVRDGVVLRLIGKWLHAGVMERGCVSYPSAGTPQGGVISPLLANVFLHAVLDRWFRDTVEARLAGRGYLFRFADDAVLVFSLEKDARRVLAVLPKRFARFGLELHPEKTRLIAFKTPRDEGPGGGQGQYGAKSFDFLGFTHYWSKSRRGYWVIKRKIAKDRLSRKLREVSEVCRRYRHEPIREQFDRLARKLEGFYQYFGITGNSSILHAFYERVRAVWKKWLGRRSQRAYRSWDWFQRLEQTYRLPRPRIIHAI